MRSEFIYNNIEIPNCTFRISPSQIGKFFSAPAVWYKDQILGEKSFTGSTSSVLGTIVHAIAESYVRGNPITREEVEEYLLDFAKKRSITDDPIDLEEIRLLYPQMSMALINEYVRHNPPTIVEEQVHYCVTGSIYLGGSCDNRTKDIVVDYKNVSKKPSNLDSIPFDYKIQLLSYAKAYKEHGVNIERIRIVYTVRPTKTLPSRVFVVTQQITPDDWELIDNTAKLIADTVIKSIEDPSLVYLLFKSYKLKES